MKTYIGTKIVKAEPQSREVGSTGEYELGYKVVYEDGYVSWSPKSVFERCYREITENELKLTTQ